MRAAQRLKELVAPVIEVIPIEEHDRDESENVDFYERLLAEKDTARPEGIVMELVMILNGGGLGYFLIGAMIAFQLHPPPA